MNEEKKPSDRARESLERGFGEVFKAASSVADAVKREVKRNAPSPGSAGGRGIGGLGRALDDASREIVRAASSVATAVGTELETWGKKAQEALDEEAVHPPQKSAPPAPPPAAASGQKGDTDDWPKTREEYEKKYGRDGDDWPRSRQEYIDKYGRPPRPKDDDPGFRIATDGVDLGGGPKR